jgi:dTDP-4-amino-4,6-dideoxygalactose transaminase
MLTKFYFDEGTKHHWPMLLGVTPELPLSKFPLFVEKAEGIRQKLKKHNIHLHDGWTGCVICPAATDHEAVGYKDGDDPDAEMAGEQILSLPTHPTMTLQQAKELVQHLHPFLKQ